MRTLVAATVLLLLAPLATADPKPVRAKVSAKDIRAPVDDWYGVYLQGKKSGHARFRVTRRPGTIVVETEMLMKLTAMDKQIEMSMVEQKVFEGKAPFRFISAYQTASLRPKVMGSAWMP